MAIQIINPNRFPKDCLLFARHEGEELTVYPDFGLVNFRLLKKNKYFYERKTGDYQPRKIYPAFAAYMKGVDGVDFVIEKINRQKVNTEMAPLLNILRSKINNR
jgi:hypothetical protein